MQAMPSTRPSAAQSLGPGGLDRDRGAHHRAQALHHGRGVRGQAGRVGDDGAVRVGAREAAGGRHGDHLGQQGHAVGALPDGIRVGEVPAQVAQADRAQHGVGQRVAHGVGVAVTAQAAAALDDDAAQDERSMRVLGEAVDVDPLADAHAHPSRSASRRSAAPRSSGSVILRLPGSPGTTCTVPPSASTNMASSVAPAAWRLGVGASQHVGPEGLGRLDRHQRGAIQRGDDLPGRVHGLDGVTRRDPGHGTVRSPAGHGLDDGGEEARRGQRSRRVVHHDHLRVGRDRGQAAAHRVGPRGAAGHDGIGTVGILVCAVAAAAHGGGQDEDHAGGRGAAGRHGPCEHRAAAQGGELLHLAEAAAGAPGHDDRPHLGHGATGPVD